MNPVFAVIAVASFVSGANLRLFDVLLPTIAEAFDSPVTTAAVVVTAFTLGYGLFQLVLGPLGDRIGKTRVIAASSFIAGTASLGSAFIDSLSALTALRFVTGIGAGGIIPLALAWIGDNTPYEKRQATLGGFLGIVLLGHILGPAVGGALAHLVTWRAVFLLFALLFFASSMALLVQDVRARKLATPSFRKIGFLRGYAEVLRDRWVRTVLLTVSIEGALFYGAFTYTGAYLKDRFGLSYLAIGAVIAAFGFGGVLYSLSVRWLLRRLGETGLVTGGAFLLLGCYVLLPLLPVWQPVVVLLIVAGIAFYMFHNTLQTRSTEMAPKSRGVALALHACCMFLGQAAGVALCGIAIRVLNYEWTFVLCGAGLALLGRWFSQRIVRHRQAREPAPVDPAPNR
ncbi:MAG: MFS transporter [Burkholderiales bacterium]